MSELLFFALGMLFAELVRWWRLRRAFPPMPMSALLVYAKLYGLEPRRWETRRTLYARLRDRMMEGVRRS